MRAELRDSLEFLFPDSPVGEKPVSRLKLDLARGATASVHLLLNGLKTGAGLRCRVRSGGRPVAGAGWFRLVEVPVEVNTGLEAFVEKEGEPNPHVIRRAPFKVYDAMEPVAGSLRVAGPAMALRLQIPVDRQEKPGCRRYEIEVEVAGERQSFILETVVHRPAIPPSGKDSFPYTNWFWCEPIARNHRLEPWSPAHWRILGRYAKLMARARQNTFLLSLGSVFEFQKDRPVLNRPRLRRLVKLFTEAGLYYIEGGHLATRHKGEWAATYFDLVLKPVAATSPEGNALLASIGRQLWSEIEGQGWGNRWIQHVADEPTAGLAADYRILCGMARKYLPGLPLLDATMDPALAGSVDIWCPLNRSYQKNRERFVEYQLLGDLVWFYTCCAPGGPWLNRLLDMELLRPALLGWGAAHFGLDGFLHWGLNYLQPGRDPFRTSVMAPITPKSWPAGDTHVVYPGPDGPWSSLRLEAQREGFEDYELLRRLRDRNPRRLAAVIRPVFRAFDDYTRDTAVFRRGRRALLAALE